MSKSSNMVLYSSTCFRVRYGLIRIRISHKNTNWGKNCVPFSRQLFVGHVRSARRFPRLKHVVVASFVLVFVLWFSRFASSVVSSRRWIIKIIIVFFRLSAPPTKHTLIRTRIRLEERFLRSKRACTSSVLSSLCCSRCRASPFFFSKARCCVLLSEFFVLNLNGKKAAQVLKE